MLLLALTLPLHVILFAIWWQFQHVINMMLNVENISNDDEFFADTVNTAKETMEMSKG